MVASAMADVRGTAGVAPFLCRAECDAKRDLDFYRDRRKE